MVSDAPERPHPTRALSTHEATLEKIVRPDHREENHTIYEKLRGGQITIDEAEHLSEVLLIKVGSIDHMTGLDNSRSAALKLEGLIDYCEQNNIPLLGLYLDGDDFKQINTKGHHIGDQVIKALGKALGEATRDTDLQVRLETEKDEQDTKARLGGDEFFIALPGATLEEALIIFGRISKNFAGLTNEIPELRNESGKPTTVTAGVAQFNKDVDRNPEGFIKRCERTMQFGKDTGTKGELFGSIVNPATNAVRTEIISPQSSGT